MTLTLQIWSSIIGIHIVSHLLIALINNLKVDRDYPLLFKTFWYMIIIGLNIIAFIIVSYMGGATEKHILYSYTGITAVIFLLHFVFDEDDIFRFEKSISLILTELIGVFALSIYSFLAF